MMDSQPTPEQLRVILVVYTSSLLPLTWILWRRFRGKLKDWIWQTYWAAFATCALGWELWFTYGWVAGEAVDQRRAEILSSAIPIHLNWLLNSLADAGAVCLGGLLLVWWLFGRDESIFLKWHWGVFAVLVFHFIAQNLIVEMFLYHDQLAEGKPLSWAPLVPTGPWFNPTLFRFGDRTITLQGQVSWLIMAPLFYAGVIWAARRGRAAPLRSTS